MPPRYLGVMLLKGKKVVAQRAFVYNKKQVMIGQIFELGGFENDALLLRLKYVIPFKKTMSIFKCDRCGAEFVSQAYRDIHTKTMHIANEVEKKEVLKKQLAGLMI